MVPPGVPCLSYNLSVLILCTILYACKICVASLKVRCPDSRNLRGVSRGGESTHRDTLLNRVSRWTTRDNFSLHERQVQGRLCHLRLTKWDVVRIISTDVPVVQVERNQLIPVLHGMHAGGTGCETDNLNQSPEFRVENWRLSRP